MQYIMTDLFLITLGIIWVFGFSVACENASLPCQIYTTIFCYVIGGTWTGFRLVVMGMRIYHRMRKGEWIEEV